METTRDSGILRLPTSTSTSSNDGKSEKNSSWRSKILLAVVIATVIVVPCLVIFLRNNGNSSQDDPPRDAALVPLVQICSWPSCPWVSRIGLGTLRLGSTNDPQSSNVTYINQWIQNALSNGINLFDLADIYPTSQYGTPGTSAILFGQAMALTPGLREKLVLVAKMDIVFEIPGIDTSQEHLSEALNFFLGALGTTYIDIVLLHYPNSVMDAAEVSKLFNSWKTAGVVHHFGTSNHYPSKFGLLQTYCDKYGIKLITNEFEVSVWNPSYLNYDSSLVDDAYSRGFRVLGWGALAGDPLGGPNRLFLPASNPNDIVRQTKILNSLSEVSALLGGTNATEDVLALAWVLYHPSGIIPLIGTTNITRLNHQLQAVALSHNLTSDMWWTIGNTGGLCPLADTQCNYAQYS